jgi:hypothetical protein
MVILYNQITNRVHPFTAYSVHNYDPAFHRGDHLGAKLCGVERVGGVVELLRLLRRGEAGAGPPVRQHRPLPGLLSGGRQAGRALQQR